MIRFAFRLYRFKLLWIEIGRTNEIYAVLLFGHNQTAPFVHSQSGLNRSQKWRSQLCLPLPPDAAHLQRSRALPSPPASRDSAEAPRIASCTAMRVAADLVPGRPGCVAECLLELVWFGFGNHWL